MNKAACQALGLLGGDEEWIYTFKEAALSATSLELRKLFVQILIFYDVSDPMNLWQTFWKDLSDDIPRRVSKALQIPLIEKSKTKMKASVLFDLEAMLNSNSKSIKDFGLPTPPEDMRRVLQNRFLMEETNYNPKLLLNERELLIPQLNEDQKMIFDEIINVVKDGRTTHSRFKIPLNLMDGCIYNIKKSHLVDFQRQNDLIIWDEASINNHRCFEALNHFLRDILDELNTLFGGKSIMLGGDFRQTLLVKKKASRLEILDTSITASYLWSDFKTYTLQQNMRLAHPGMIEDQKVYIQSFSEWLLNIGDGNTGEPDNTEDTFKIQIPKNLCILDFDIAITELINFIYDDNTFQMPAPMNLQKKVIVCLKNETTDGINTRVIALLNHQQHVYLSSDDTTPHGNDGGEMELLYPNEYLNSLKFAGLPPHMLELKVSAPIILLRNLKLIGGLCNETCMIVTQLLPRVIEAWINTGT
nr:DNA helicase [Tanacetum cinerariifolium]